MEKIILASVLLLLLFGCTSQGPSSQSVVGAQTAPAPSSGAVGSSPGSQSVASGQKTFTASDVSQHNAASNCWVIVNGKVYDITSFISSGMHSKPLDGFCGTDATTAFDTRSGMGPHPQKAIDTLSGFYIGDLKG